MNLASAITSVVSAIPDMIPGLTIDIQTELRNTGIDPATNKPYDNSLIESSGYKAVISELTEDERNNAALTLTQLKLDVICNGDKINDKCNVKLNRGAGIESFDIIKNNLTMAGSIPVLNTLYLKK